MYLLTPNILFSKVLAQSKWGSKLCVIEVPCRMRSPSELKKGDGGMASSEEVVAGGMFSVFSDFTIGARGEVCSGEGLFCVFFSSVDEGGVSELEPLG